jgi:Protein of unknown function (DUF3105)
MRRGALALACASLCALAVGLVGCGGGGGGGNGTTSATGSTSTSDQDAARFPRNSSVGSGLGGAPPLSPVVRRAAQAAGCTVATWPSDGQLQPDGTLHVQGDPKYTRTLPPTSGLHNPVWADYGVYDTFVPYKFQVHDLEHGAIIVNLGRALSPADRDAIVALWREAPPFVIVVPQDPSFDAFPPKGVVVTSWQRWMVCKPFTTKALRAIRVYRDTYRGTGPEPVGALDSGASADGLPKPAIPDEGAR